MKQSYLAFDIEISTPIPPGASDWMQYRPFGISCAATMVTGEEPRLWHGAELPGGGYPQRMSQDEVQGLILYIDEMRRSGVVPLTWNGLGFDFDVLAEESGTPEMARLCRDIALEHVDIAFSMFCEKGFMIGLDAAAKGMGLAGKTAGLTGDKIPGLWASGLKGQMEVLEYVAQDVQATAGIHAEVQRHGVLRWTSRAGRPAAWRPERGRVLAVAEALRMPEPDTSWMDRPWSRTKFSGWTERVG